MFPSCRRLPKIGHGNGPGGSSGDEVLKCLKIRSKRGRRRITGKERLFPSADTVRAMILKTRDDF